MMQSLAYVYYCLYSQGEELTFYAIPATVNNDPVDIVMQDRDTLNSPVDCRIKEGM